MHPRYFHWTSVLCALCKDTIRSCNSDLHFAVMQRDTSKRMKTACYCWDLDPWHSVSPMVFTGVVMVTREVLWPVTKPSRCNTNTLILPWMFSCSSTFVSWVIVHNARIKCGENWSEEETLAHGGCYGQWCRWEQPQEVTICCRIATHIERSVQFWPAVPYYSSDT